MYVVCIPVERYCNVDVYDLAYEAGLTDGLDPEDWESAYESVSYISWEMMQPGTQDELGQKAYVFHDYTVAKLVADTHDGFVVELEPYTWG